MASHPKKIPEIMCGEINVIEHVSNLQAQLLQHQERRCLGVPTVSTLVGSIQSARSLVDQRYLFVSNPTDWFEYWIERLFVGTDLAELIRERACERLHVNKTNLLGSFERDLLIKQIGWDRNDRGTSLLSNQLNGQTRLSWLFHDQTEDLSELIKWLVSIVPGDQLPGIAFYLDRIANAVTTFTCLDQILSITPEIPVACCVDAVTWEIICEDFPQSRIIQTIGENLIFLDDVLNDDAALSCKQKNSTQDRLDSMFNSRQEQILYERLQSNPKTKDLFEPNGDPGFTFGGRPAEIDLVSRKVGIAIEIDGYYHFSEAERYRRDRRKDYLMQQHGYLVLRFLAEDVEHEIEPILAQIVQAVCKKDQEKPIGNRG